MKGSTKRLLLGTSSLLLGLCLLATPMWPLAMLCAVVTGLMIALSL